MEEEFYECRKESIKIVGKVSIIVPVYNAQEYIEQCILSILKQTYESIELILVDDGSSDASGAICNEYANKDNRVKVISQENQGVSAARNNGLALVTGEYVMFVDADDYLHSNDAIASLILAAKENEYPDVVQFRKVNDKTKYDSQRKSGQMPINGSLISEMLVDERLNTLWNKFYKRSLVETNNLSFPSGIRMGEDLLFNANFFKFAETIVFLDRQLYFYRVDNLDSVTNRYIVNKYDDLMFVNGELAKILGRNSARLRSALNYIRMKNVISCIEDLHNEACKMTDKQKMEEVLRYKKENKNLFVRGYGIVKFGISVMYWLMDGRVLYTLIGFVRFRSIK